MEGNALYKHIELYETLKKEEKADIEKRLEDLHAKVDEMNRRMDSFCNVRFVGWDGKPIRLEDMPKIQKAPLSEEECKQVRQAQETEIARRLRKGIEGNENSL